MPDSANGGETDSDERSGPETDQRPRFSSPWQARTFGIAVALADRDVYEWDQFNQRFVDNRPGVNEPVDERRDPPTSDGRVEDMYYQEWLEAVETLILEAGVVSEDALEARVAEFERGDRDASEFVSGPRVPHPHDHVHNHHK